MPQNIYNIGIITTTVTTVISLISFIVLYIKKVNLDKKLELEYGIKKR